MTDDAKPASQANDAAKKRGFVAWLRRPPKWSMFSIVLVGLLSGIAIWGALNTGMEYTNRTEFCVSCHEMTIPAEELKKTVHYKNRSGTTVACADCHVASSKNPTDYGRKFEAKIMAARDVLGKITGVVDTPEKFEAHRLTMAKRVWERMKNADSRECRNCHKFETMDPAKQKDRAVVKHEGAIEDGKTCIDCHKGIAHKAIHQLLDQESPAAKP
jgi:cytochrome c-type protein NapC